jgi:hypothetical protein
VWENWNTLRIFRPASFRHSNNDNVNANDAAPPRKASRNIGSFETVSALALMGDEFARFLHQQGMSPHLRRSKLRPWTPLVGLVGSSSSLRDGSCP